MIKVRMELQIDPAQAKLLADEGFDALRPDLLKFADDAGKDFVARMQRMLRSHSFGSGKIYWAKGEKRRASLPGQVPVDQTHEYVNSYASDTRSLKKSVQGRAGAVNHGHLAWILEYGGKFMRPRTHIRTVFNEWKAALSSQIGGA